MISGLGKTIRALESKVKFLSKQHNRELREVAKAHGGRRKRTQNPEKKEGRAESGIKKPVGISDDLCEFLGEPSGTLLSRPEVTKRIFAYLRERGLQNAENKTIFKVDDQLSELLGDPVHLIRSDKPHLGYGYSSTNLQRYLIPHFTKKDVVVVPAAVGGEEEEEA